MQKLIILFLLLLSYHLPAQNILITISLSEANQVSTPMRVQLSKPLAIDMMYFLRNVKTKKNIPAQLLDSVTLLFMTEGMMPVGDHSYSLIADNNVNVAHPVKVEKKENGLLVKVRNKPVFFYHTKEAKPPPDSPAYYRRSGFIHPLYSPSGKILTDDFPAGHAHQHAIFTAWTSTTYKKTSVDFWNQHSRKGTVEHDDDQRIETIQGPVISQIKVFLSHKSHQFGEVLKEKWTLTIYPSDKYFLFDLESEQQNTSTDTLFLNKYHYGGLGFRGSKHWNSEDHANFKSAWNILTSEGLKDSSANASHARWVDAWGKIDDAVVGTTVFNHPSNFRYPQALRVHPVMPYWAYSPVVDGPFYIAPGASYKAKFRYYVHEGQSSPETIESLFKSWAQPGEVRLTYR
jgi:hypothetical protein